ncbi:hypothetical protein QR680_014746 [Steinernema hermaphroditum]|uniref:C-type lectin domain-containing protein n=1 Tax=Steinernema hermaphroditum TaxID=289476 RepID=A0AA39IC88_9BILA|nr:hypothetical protein QR680_014746 [Steinernema hermaphroditum]
MAENASARIAQNSDFWYVINPINMDFNAAEEHCISLKGHLASIHSTAEHDVVKELIRLHGFEDYHVVRLGGYRLPNTTTFIWNDQSAWDFNNWYPTQSKTADTVTVCCVDKDFQERYRVMFRCPLADGWHSTALTI